ncbi:MAG: YggT family protein [Thermacetogeniaceae bacterium]
MTAMSVLTAAISWGIEIYVWMILIRVFLSFAQPRRYSPLLGFIYHATEPVLNLCRRVMPVTRSGIDFSPFLAIIGLELVKAVFIYLLNQIVHFLGG